MKIFFIDTAVDGHHSAYIRELVNGNSWQSEVALPEYVTGLNCDEHIYQHVDLNNKKFISYIKWMHSLYKYAKKIKPDIVHFLMGDNFYKYFGLGLGFFSGFKTVTTVHWVRSSSICKLSLKVFSKKCDKVILHSEYLKLQADKLGVKNCVAIEYPQFKDISVFTKMESRKYFGLDLKEPVIACIGNTRFDKGLDILLSALKNVSLPFQLFIAGKPEDFDMEYITSHSRKFLSKIKMAMRYLSDDEIGMAINAADFIALPYRKIFNGASGPLGEGVSCGKCIIGSDHGNLGYTIKSNHLGFTFVSEDANDLSRVINVALSNEFVVDEYYKQYQLMIKPEIFYEKHYRLYLDLLS